MKVSITELNEKVNKYLIACGLDQKDADKLTEIVIEQEMIGNQFSAIGELPHKHKRLITKDGQAKAEVVVDKPAAMLVKGNGQLATLLTANYLSHMVNNAKGKGIYAFGIYDSTYNDFFDVFCRRIAAQDCIAIIVENGGPQGVVPFGGKTDVTGTNPIAYGIPTNDDPIIFDAATAMHAYGLMGQAKKRGELLPENAYVDKEGNVTTDPEVAYAVLPFGGFKGFGINLLIDVLSGSLVRGKSGLDQPLDSQRYIGTFIIVIDPAAFGDLKTFKNSTSKLVKDILDVKPVDPSQPVRVPGLRGAKRLREFKKEGMVEIRDEDWNEFSAAFDKLTAEK